MKATSNNIDFCYERPTAASGFVSEEGRISFNNTLFRSLASHPQILVLAAKPVARGGHQPANWTPCAFRAGFAA
jgi:hypothetical protein